MALLGFLVPMLMAISSFCLRDLLLLFGWIVLTLLIIPIALLNIVYNLVLHLITHIDNFLIAIFDIITKPILLEQLKPILAKWVAQRLL